MDYHPFFLNNTRQFLAVRQLSFSQLQGVVKRQYAEVHTALITSSPVHGIANVGSDIDLICLVPALQQDQAMASQIYLGEHHLEVVAFALEDVERAFAELALTARKSTLDKLVTFKSWEKYQPIPKKYMERLVSGVSTEEELPYLEHQNALSSVWACAAFDDFRQSACFSILAWRSGEYRAAAAYASNAVLFLMNAVLAKKGWVNSNRKWTLLRWYTAFTVLMVFVEDELSRSMEQLWQRTYPACRGGLQRDDVMRLCELVERAEREFNCEPDYASLKPHVDVYASSAFMPGVTFVLNEEQQATLLPSGVLADIPDTRPSDLVGQSPHMADYLLRGARAGLIEFSLAQRNTTLAGAGS